MFSSLISLPFFTYHEVLFKFSAFEDFSRKKHSLVKVAKPKKFIEKMHPPPEISEYKKKEKMKNKTAKEVVVTGLYSP